ncbi:regulator of G protein signaling domain-containing protein [Fusarium redolens]|uniref:Regulator of G protein signaling domain-containing protein n=1 Tax=Fusarium redolens TaxID=48865 RepID=A0A9P9KJY4_FUSRE|nr:regulator of G protein signaling domain-containing protein [Fusarium redolens]KAH7265737.1 regulator of G protein signaling domain-containing protein [Fusarium redolens]
MTVIIDWYKHQQVYTIKGSVWQLTPKEITILDRFCARNGIQKKQVSELANLKSTPLVVLERDSQTDKLHFNQGIIEIVFRRLVGAVRCNAMLSLTAADSSSMLEYRDSITEVKTTAELKVNGKTYHNTFTGKAIIDWLMNYSTIMEEREAVAVATLFVAYNLIKHAIYQLTQRAKDLINGSSSLRPSPEREHYTSYQRNEIRQRDFSSASNPETYCEENLTFYQDVDEFIWNSKRIYHAFLAAGSPCELNIDHQLRNSLTTRMTKAVSQVANMINTLEEVIFLFEEAQDVVFKLMASDLGPKFLNNPKY